ncbi:TldD/PmbA family protein [Commensalibacter papalotli (ex Botero et al. 2024)]|uniref:Zn-dependent protease PmbA/TldA or its inactivated homolog (TldD) (PDB:3TV9) (PUBMED:12029038) n=1 Tax=Commensalibacter papalotli (ex Botero et al. 2024) TaxID=2972766 RepID=A0ABM9HJQ8_9PROT|nr:TldD/PmbA family protein [Commensalibacter papalotli (ex Botero et al. 2024)]CAI3923440.1 Zn-dependent protease PmbA/TldA or its inactivated homolog (TldD) (PDB:3TV9) (PUBMED:12029038) [Commensalibacter papalotli (ex Botero et al. 2024)]CAI3928582.1 Zn-dependent protease PmbA/TldA or its inactivated homolog (TldD) (PDB:3TV9) (PUBMED:12029038) [Commensalibacter papalotli (ex Botero et al. 2024)]
MTQHQKFIKDLIHQAKKAGATEADAVMLASTSVGVQVRNGQPEELERSETKTVGLRVFIDKRSATISTTDLQKDNIEKLVEQAISMAKILPEDPFSGLPEPSDKPCIDPRTLDLLDASERSTQEMLEQAKRAEAAALAVKGVTNSMGGSCGYGKTEMILANSNDFFGTYARTSHSLSACVLAGTGTDMQRDYDYHSTVHLKDLEDAEQIGRSAGEKAVAKLNPTKPKTGILPVIFDPRVANSIIGHLASALNGYAIARGTSFLKNDMGNLIFPEGITIIDQPYQVKGLASRPFDVEGLYPEELKLVDQGKIANWLLDNRTANQLGLKSNGHATRGPSSPPSPTTTNLYVMAGQQTPTELMADIKEGLYITEMIGSSVNMLTGDYSRGASGFMIRNGQIAEPIMEFTLASTLKEMFSQLHVANDLKFRYSTNSPTLRIDAMSVAGN